MYNISANTLFVGKKNVYLPTCQSTNDEAVLHINSQNAIEGTTFITSQQTKGRGQRGNTWKSQTDKNITVSVILKPKFLSAQNQFCLNLISSLAVLDTFSEFVPEGLSVKWPNDLYYQDQKIGGILIENMLSKDIISYSVIGIGLNINQREFGNLNATSLGNIKNTVFQLSSLYEILFQHLEKRYLQAQRKGTDFLKTNYLASLYWYQEQHLFEDLRNSKKEHFFEGQILGIDKNGRLAIEIKGTIAYFNFKEVRFCK